jgi:endonuclease YncB( thermonuclease family)
MVRKKITKWIDGDSGFFTDGTNFRLTNVRAPEKNKRGGTKATKVAAGMSGRSNGFVTVNLNIDLFSNYV